MARKRRLWRVIGLVGAIGVVLLVGTGVEAAHLENRDSFCASCHSEPESTYFDRSTAPSAVDLASFHTTEQVRCIDCHAGPGVTGRIGALTLGARDLTHYLIGSYAQPAVQTRPITDAQCTKCHADIGDNQSFQNHFHFFLSQWQDASPDAASCVDCHQSHTTDGLADISFLNEARTTQVCQACHAFAGER